MPSNKFFTLLVTDEIKEKYPQNDCTLDLLFQTCTPLDPCYQLTDIDLRMDNIQNKAQQNASMSLYQN